MQTSSELLKLLVWVAVICNADCKDDWVGRTWQTNLNYNNSHNWDIGRVPCDADRIVFRSSESLMLEFPEGQSLLREIVLPSYVELVLPRNGTVGFTGVRRSSTCNGQDAVFKHVDSLKWTNPHNWDKWSKATPDLERVPCAIEAVRFPLGATYRISTPDNVKIGSLEINGVTLESFDWYMYANNEDSVRQFYKTDGQSSHFEISGNPCRASEWCECGNEYLQSEICPSTKACPMAYCKQPVKPSGFCCPLCGVYFMLEGTSHRKKYELIEHIKTFLTDKGIVWHASKVREFIQIVLMEDDDYSGQVTDVAEELKTSIINDGLGLRVKLFYASGHVWYPTSFTQVIGHFFSLMVFASLTLAGIVVFYSKNWSWLRYAQIGGRPFVFARFENHSEELMVAHERRQPTPPEQPQAFDNPMYGATSQEQRNVTVENPIYTELMESSETDKEKDSGPLESTDFTEK